MNKKTGWRYDTNPSALGDLQKPRGRPLTQAATGRNAGCSADITASGPIQHWVSGSRLPRTRKPNLPSGSTSWPHVSWCSPYGAKSLGAEPHGGGIIQTARKQSRHFWREVWPHSPPSDGPLW